MLFSILRFWINGWIRTQYIDPTFYFPFIEGVAPLEGVGMYVIFAIMALSAVFIAVGFYYQIAAVSFFILFTYVELIDKTNYLNHYYFVSLVSFLMIWLPANRRFSVDVLRKVVLPQREVAVGMINLIRFQLGIVYFFAGIAKINYDWLINGQPLKIWLSAHTHKPLVGWMFQYKLTAYLFSWFGMVYDIFIPFLLCFRKTLPFAYLLVVGFHLMTWWLFPIGMFPFIMIMATTTFFREHAHEQVISKLERFLNTRHLAWVPVTHLKRNYLVVGCVFIALQLSIPMRYTFNPGNVFWNEAGYRFSWRVMLMEKAGYATFYVTDADKKVVVANYDYLTPTQEKMMATQPDMILQFGRFLKKEYKNKGFEDPRIMVESFVTLNGRPSKQFIDPTVDIASIKTSNRSKWVLAYD